MIFTPITRMGCVLYFIFLVLKTSLLLLVMRSPNHSNRNTEVFIYQGFLFTPGSTRGFIMLKRPRKSHHVFKLYMVGVSSVYSKLPNVFPIIVQDKVTRGIYTKPFPYSFGILKVGLM